MDFRMVPYQTEKKEETDMPITTENTTFTRDVFGRYVCNTFDEAIASTDSRNGGSPFDVIVIGGGSFGGVLAQRLFRLDQRPRRHRVLVLEAGPFLLSEHIQNLPVLGDVMQEVRRTPWTSPPALGLTFPGLAFCLAGRSLFWGGWSPRLTDSELADWPPALVKDLKDAYFDEAKRQIGTDTLNDFIFGPLHDTLRTNLWDRIGNIQHRFEMDSPEKLEAPLAVVSAAQRAGVYPTNKFSSMQLLIDGARRSWVESNGDDRRKRLMIVPNCQVNELVVDGNKVIAVKTSLGDVALSPNGQVVIALGTIESARLALRSFPNTHKLIGCNLMGHLRTNFSMRIPRKGLGIPADRLYASALFVKCKSPNGHFHFQITASAAGPDTTDSEAELFKKIPSIDELDFFDVNDEDVIIVIRGIGEMKGDRTKGSKNRVDLIPLATGPTQAAVNWSANVLLTDERDKELWKDMEAATLQVADALADGKPYKKLFGPQRDNLGTTHHEAGTLWMGTDPTKSVTDIWGRFHEVPNAWAAGPALFPTVGSPNPMLTGVALARRTAEHMFEQPFAEPVEQPISLFNGTNLDGWQQAGPGRFSVENGMLVTEGGLGLLWYAAHQFRNFELRVGWMVTKKSDNSGVFVRFPDPNGDPWVAVKEGYEIQIDDEGAPDGDLIHKTGAIYGVQAPAKIASKAPGDWNTFVIRVEGQTYNATLNGEPVITNFKGNRSVRGHIGLQNHLPKDQVFFRNIIMTPL